MKKRINIFLSREVIEILDQAKKMVSNPRKKVGRGEIVDAAVIKTYKDRKQILDEQMRFHQRELMRLKEEREALDGGK